MCDAADTCIDVPNENLESWLSILKPYQADQIKDLLAQGLSEEKVVDAWLSARGPNAVLVFGGVREGAPFRERFFDEFRKFICGDRKYSKDRAQLTAKIDVAKTALVSGVSAAIATQVGAAVALLIPAVAVLLHIVGKIGVNAWCAGTDKEVGGGKKPKNSQ